jgi:two-component system OmpR family sensor kinase
VRGRPTARLRAALANASLRVRVMAVAAILVTVTSVVMGSLGTALLRGYLISRADQQLSSFAALASHRLAGSGSRFQPPRPPGPSGLPLQFLVEVIGAGGKVQVAGRPQHDMPPPQIPAAQLAHPAGTFTTTAAGDPAGSWRVLIKALPGGRRVVVAFSLADLNSTVTRLEVADAAAGVIAIALLAGIGLPLVRMSLSPLAGIERTAAAIAAGDLSRRIDHPPLDTEVGRLAEALNAMLGRIEAAYRAREEGEAYARESEERMRRFVADASHELRTPLTAVRGLAEFSLQQGDGASRTELLRLMALVQQESSRMGRLVEDLLMLAQFDEHPPLDRHLVDLSSIAAEAVQAARLVQPGRRIALLADEPVIVLADGGRIRQVIDNLVGNARQHTPAGSPVTVTVHGRAGQAELTVADNGPGLTAEQAARVFERFYRTDRARSRARGGTGLGLSIAATLTAAHGGTITVDTEAGHGAAFHIWLPLAAGASAGPAGR